MGLFARAISVDAELRHLEHSARVQNRNTTPSLSVATNQQTNYSASACATYYDCLLPPSITHGAINRSVAIEYLGEEVDVRREDERYEHRQAACNIQTVRSNNAVLVGRA